MIILAEGNEDRFDFNTIVIGSIAITVVLLLLAPMLMVIGKETSYSAYESSSLAQLSEMRCDLGDDLDGCADDSNDLGYFTANTMSTPMLVNDWKDPHRTMLVIVSPEKPIDETAADAIYDFVTEKGGKVIVAADNTNANRLASKFGVSYFDKPLLDQNQHWLEYNQDDTVKEPVWRNVWSVASVENDVNEMEAGAARKGCSEFQISNNDPKSCRIPVMFRSPTGIRFEPTAEDLPQNNPDTQREVNVLATASSSAFIDIIGEGDASDVRNPAPGDLALMVRIDYPGIPVFDKVTGKGGFSDLEDPQWMYGVGRNAGYHAVEFQNNSSNNQGNIGHWNGSSFSYLQQNSGTNGNDWRLWRVNGVLKAKAGGNSIVTIQSSGDRRDYVIWNSSQSPCFCRVKQAFRNASGGA